MMQRRASPCSDAAAASEEKNSPLCWVRAAISIARKILLLYEYDGSVDKARPELVVFPAHHRGRRRASSRSRASTACPSSAAARAPGLSGGAIPRAGGVMIAFARMNRILEIDLANERAVVQPGVVNLDITLAVQAQSYFYAPDPSSQRACTIGGNVAENAGGPHTLAYGVTTNHVLGLEMVLPDGSVVTYRRQGDAICPATISPAC